MTIMYANPVLCAILGWAFRAERVGIMGALGIAVTMLGVVFVAQPPVIFGGHEWSHARMAGASQGTYQHRETASIMALLIQPSSACISLHSITHDFLCHGKGIW